MPRNLSAPTILSSTLYFAFNEHLAIEEAALLENGLVRGASWLARWENAGGGRIRVLAQEGHKYWIFQPGEDARVAWTVLNTKEPNAFNQPTDARRLERPD